MKTKHNDKKSRSSRVEELRRQDCHHKTEPRHNSPGVSQLGSTENHAQARHSRESGNPSFSRLTMGPRLRRDDADFSLPRVGRTPTETPQYLNFSTFAGNKARMLMKTKDNDKKSRSSEAKSGCHS